MSLDVNECEGGTAPCDEATEVCSNLLGTYSCKCKSGLVKGEEGKCVTAEEREAQREAKKAKKKKKKRKKKEAEAEQGKTEEDPVDKRRIYPWYYMVAPLTATYVSYKYLKPNLITSMGIILFITASATLS